jgi:hypothetical protein
MSVVFAAIALLVAWFAYRLGVERGRADGFKAGFGAGLKQGRDEGMYAGLKAGIKEHMVTTLVDARPVPGMHEDLHQQVKDELLTAINTKTEQKKASAPKPSFLLLLWEELGGWFLIAVFALLLVYLFRSG